MVDAVFSIKKNVLFGYEKSLIQKKVYFDLIHYVNLGPLSKRNVGSKFYIYLAMHIRSLVVFFSPELFFLGEIFSSTERQGSLVSQL